MASTASEIKIKNIYYMLAYSYEALNQTGFQELGTEEFKDIYDLMTAVLTKGIVIQMRRGVYKEYRQEQDNLRTVRSKINILKTFQNTSAKIPAVYCEYETFDENNLLNQILKTTLLKLQKQELSEDNRKAIKKVLPYFINTDTVDLRTVNWHKIKFHHNNKTYQMLINVCYLLFDGLLPTEDAGTKKFTVFLKDERMRKLFEKFVFELCKRELSGVKVGYQNQIDWKLEADGGIDYLPTMNADITLTRGKHRLIIDTKFYKEALKRTQYDKQVLVSSNLYQIYAYIKNSVFDGRVSGMLLYPTVDYTLKDKPMILEGGSAIFFRTVELNQAFDGIKADLIRIAQESLNLYG